MSDVIVVVAAAVFPTFAVRIDTDEGHCSAPAVALRNMQNAVIILHSDLGLFLADMSSVELPAMYTLRA